MMYRNRMIDRWRFWLDQQLSKGTSVLLILLFTVVLVALIGVTIAIVVLGAIPNADMSIGDILWTVFAYMYDPTSVPYREGVWVYRALMLIASLFGVVVLSTLIGIITTSFNSLIENLRKGKSPVTTTGHTILLGWSDQIFSVLHELAIASENQKDQTVVILAEKDKVEMEDEIRLRVPQHKSITVVCRSGSPIDRTDLDIVKPQYSRSIIIVPSDQGEDLDTLVVKCMLAILKIPRSDGTAYNIVASMTGQRNMSAASVLAGNQAHLVPAEQIIAQIIAQTSRQPGLAQVYSELLDFEGDELYLTDAKEFVGKKFRDLLLAFSNSTVFGLKRASGEIQINPPMDEIVTAGSSIIVLSEDDDTMVAVAQNFEIQHDAIVSNHTVPSVHESFLILGWNKRGSTILRELDHYVPNGTRVSIVDNELLATDFAEWSEGLFNLKVSSQVADPTDRNILNTLAITQYTSVIILADTELGIQNADSRTLMTLIHLRDIIGQSEGKINIVTEILDDRNRELAGLSDVNDFIVSNKIVSMMLTQIAENRDLYKVFVDLFDAEGSEIYLKPITDYVVTTRPVTFATLIISAASRNQIAIGYKLNRGQDAGVYLNVSKSLSIPFNDGDQLIVISDN